MLNEWQERRSEFNHDWLKNQFSNRLNAFLERLRGERPDVERLFRFVNEDLPEWKSHEPEARWLVESVESEMSPRRFFDEPPLNRCDAETKQWLPGVVQQIWLSRYPVRVLQKQAGRLLTRVNGQYAKLCANLEKTPSENVHALVSLRPEFSELSRRCIELHDMFSTLDSKIKRI
jgi:hypothetical protein